VAYHLQFNFAIDGTAIQLSSNPPPGGFAVSGDPINFWQNNNGLSGDGPFTFNWDFGDGTTSTDPAPFKVNGYAITGTYTVTLVMTDRFGCPSAPELMQYVVVAPTPTPTPTNTPTATPTNTPLPPPPTNPPAPQPPSQPTSTPVFLPTPTPTPTVIVPVLLPETGTTDRSLRINPAFPIVGGILLIAVCLLLCHSIRRS
jgi:PKD repeat protein